MTTLRMGSRGDDVAQLQRQLAALGYQVAIDGAFGPQTLAAVLDVQGAARLSQDGVVGPRTQAVLRAATPPAPTTQGIRAWGELLPCAVPIHADDPFGSPRQRPRVTQIVIHESITHDPDVLEDEPGEADDATERVLDRRHLGVHIMIGVGPDGAAQVVQHNDLRDALSHTGRPVNDLSVGLEIVNPYYDRAGIWTQIIDAPWAHKGRYTLPIPVQVEAAYQIIEALWAASGGAREGLHIPRTFWGQSGDSFSLSPVDGDKARAGVLAHYHYGHHADGAWVALYCAIRARGLSPADSYRAAREIAAGARRAVTLPRQED
jgi:N-acetyl-anhydromuramyl-L-alanine amidase AmpD